MFHVADGFSRMIPQSFENWITKGMKQKHVKKYIKKGMK